MTTVNESYKYCHQIMKKHSKSFSYAFDLLPESERRAVWSVYAVCRIIDDSIDEEQNPQKLQAIVSGFLCFMFFLLSAISSSLLSNGLYILLPVTNNFIPKYNIIKIKTSMIIDEIKKTIFFLLFLFLELYIKNTLSFLIILLIIFHFHQDLSTLYIIKE